jgi:hypothetical protein
MALLNFRCECGETSRVFSNSCDPGFTTPVCKCGSVMERDVKGPSTHVKERLDNGIMVKALERYSDAERIFKERHDNADPLAGTKANRS